MENSGLAARAGGSQRVEVDLKTCAFKDSLPLGDPTQERAELGFSVPGGA